MQWEREKLLITSNFSFSHSVFYPYGELSEIFIKYEIVVWKSKFVVGKGLTNQKFCNLQIYNTGEA